MAKNDGKLKCTAVRPYIRASARPSVRRQLLISARNQPTSWPVGNNDDDEKRVGDAATLTSVASRKAKWGRSPPAHGA